MTPITAATSFDPTAATAPASSAVAAAVSTAPPATTLHANPVSLLDPSTGLVVLEFYNAKGEETASLPTKKQLDLYRLNESSPDVFQPAIRDVALPPPEVGTTAPAGKALPTRA